MSTDLQVGLVGCGRLAEHGYVPALRRASGVRLAAVADPDHLRRERVAGGARAYDSAAVLLAEGGIDALVFATPAETHLADAELAAAANVPALIEKPPAPDALQAATIARASPPPRIGFNRRFQPGQSELRAAIPDQATLDLTLEFRYRRRTWRPHTVDDDALLDLGPHLIDLALWLGGGEARSVRATAMSHSRAALELELDRGRARISCAIDRPYLERVEVRDGGGRLLGRSHSGGLATAVLGPLSRRGGEHPLVASLALQLEAFARAVRGVPEPALATAADGLAVMAVIDAARLSAQHEGRRQPVAASGM